MWACGERGCSWGTNSSQEIIFIKKICFDTKMQLSSGPIMALYPICTLQPPGLKLPLTPPRMVGAEQFIVTPMTHAHCSLSQTQITQIEL